MVGRYQRAALATRLHIPLIYGVDAVHGDGDMYGATVFPHNIGLGASRDPKLASDIEQSRPRRRGRLDRSGPSPRGSARPAMTARATSPATA